MPCSRFASLDQQLRTLFSKDVAAVFMSVDESGRKELIEICSFIYECEAAAKRWLDRVVGVEFASFGTSAAVLDARGTGKASNDGPSKQGIL